MASNASPMSAAPIGTLHQRRLTPGIAGALVLVFAIGLASGLAVPRPSGGGIAIALPIASVGPRLSAGDIIARNDAAWAVYQTAVSVGARLSAGDIIARNDAAWTTYQAATSTLDGTVGR